MKEISRTAVCLEYGRILRLTVRPPEAYMDKKLYGHISFDLISLGGPEWSENAGVYIPDASIRVDGIQDVTKVRDALTKMIQEFESEAP